MRSREVNNRRSIGKRKLAPENYLIMCEGEETEPNYFAGLKDLVNYTEKFVNQAGKRYGKVWIVFDKDDYQDKQFNQAIKNSSFNIAQSNPCFEIWILLHLKKVINFVPKDKILNELDKEFKKYGLGNYRKNDKNIFKKISKDDNLNKAITNARKLNDKFKDEEPSKSNPMTTVYKIVEDLKEYL